MGYGDFAAQDARAKHGSTVSKMAARYKASIETPHGPRTCFEAVRIREGNQKPLVARFGGIPLERRKNAVIIDRAPGRDPYPARRSSPGSSGTGANCASTAAKCRCTTSPGSPTSHIPAAGQPAWARLMAKRWRKSLVVCALRRPDRCRTA